MSDHRPAVSARGVLDGDPAALAGLCDLRGPSVVAYCEVVCGPDQSVDAAAAAFAAFRSTAVGAVHPLALDPDSLLLAKARSAAADRAPDPAGGVPRREDPLCPEVPRLLAGAAGHALAPADRHHLRRHLARCVACRGAQNTQREAERAYLHPPAGPLDPIARQAMIAALRHAAPVAAEAAAVNSRGPTATAPPDSPPAAAYPTPSPPAVRPDPVTAAAPAPPPADRPDPITAAAPAPPPPPDRPDPVRATAYSPASPAPADHSDPTTTAPYGPPPPPDHSDPTTTAPFAPPPPTDHSDPTTTAAAPPPPTDPVTGTLAAAAPALERSDPSAPPLPGPSRPAPRRIRTPLPVDPAAAGSGGAEPPPAPARRSVTGRVRAVRPIPRSSSRRASPAPESPLPGHPPRTGEAATGVIPVDQIAAALGYADPPAEPPARRPASGAALGSLVRRLPGVRILAPAGVVLVALLVALTIAGVFSPSHPASPPSAPAVPAGFGSTGTTTAPDPTGTARLLPAPADTVPPSNGAPPATTGGYRPG